MVVLLQPREQLITRSATGEAISSGVERPEQKEAPTQTPTDTHTQIQRVWWKGTDWPGGLEDHVVKFE